MPKGPQGQKRPADVIGNAVGVMWIKVHKSLRVTPAMEAGLSKQICTFDDLAMLIEAHTQKAGPRGPYQKRISN